jgi:hypothetical protein
VLGDELGVALDAPGAGERVVAARGVEQRIDWEWDRERRIDDRGSVLEGRPSTGVLAPLELAAPVRGFRAVGDRVDAKLRGVRVRRY